MSFLQLNILKYVLSSAASVHQFQTPLQTSNVGISLFYLTALKENYLALKKLFLTNNMLMFVPFMVWISGETHVIRIEFGSRLEMPKKHLSLRSIQQKEILSSPRSF